MSARQGGTRSGYIFLLLVTLSTLYFLFSEPSFKAIGALLMLWGAVALGHVFWVSETLKRGLINSEKDARPKGPVGDILGALSREHNRREVSRAVRLITPRFLLAIGFFAVFIGAGILASFSPTTLPGAVDLSEAIRTYLEAQNIQSAVHFDPLFHARFAALGHMLMIGLIFWVAQMMGHDRGLLWLATLFGFSAIASLWVSSFTLDLLSLSEASYIGLGWAHLPLLQDLGLAPLKAESSLAVRVYEIGWIGAASLYLCILSVATCFIPSALRRSQKPPALWGAVAVLLVLVGADVFLTKHVVLNALWISGWALLGVLFAQMRGTARRSVTLYQI